jgi:ankyrin repeat protein
MVNRVLAAGADANLNAPIVAAAANGHVEVVRLLLQEGADINNMAGQDKKSKRKARRSRRSAVPNPGEKFGGWSALMAASLNRHDPTVKLLLDRGANPNVANDSGRTALILACGTAIVDVTEWADREMNTLYRARKNLPVLEAKIKELEIKSKGFFKKEAAQKRLARAKAELAKARRAIQTLENEKAPAKKAANETRLPVTAVGRLGLIEQLLRAGADVNAQDKYGTSALLAAAFEGDYGAVNLLIAKGADIHLKNGVGWTPLIVAAARGDTALQNVLTDKGASLAEKDRAIIGRLANTLERFTNKPARKRQIRR